MDHWLPSTGTKGIVASTGRIYSIGLLDSVMNAINVWHDEFLLEDVSLCPLDKTVLVWGSDLEMSLT